MFNIMSFTQSIDFCFIISGTLLTVYGYITFKTFSLENCNLVVWRTNMCEFTLIYKRVFKDKTKLICPTLT